MNYQLLDTILKIEDVSLSFGEKKILRDINLEIKDIVRTGTTTGQIVTVLGLSGVGKTQLFKIIAGLQKPTNGKVFITKDLSEVVPGKVGLVDQKYPLFDHRTLLGNLKLISKDKERIEYFINEFGLIDHKDKYPAQLSGGQRQRAAIIQQLLCSEHFVLLDEPFSGLDPLAIAKLTENIIKVASLDEMNTVLISSHILEPALAVSDSVWVLGHELDETNKKIEGATIRYKWDLAANGLAWRPDIQTDPDFLEFCAEVRKIFKTL